MRLVLVTLLLVYGCSGVMAQPEAPASQKPVSPISFDTEVSSGATQILSYAGGKQFVVNIPDDYEKTCPPWTADMPNPPVSAERALRLAIKKRDKVVKASPEYVWTLYGVMLVPLNKDRGVWYWEIDFEQRSARASGSTGIPPDLRLIVTMDGKVVEPEVRDSDFLSDGPAQ